MLVGFLVGAIYLYMMRANGLEPIWGIDHLRFGIFGMAASLISMVVVSLMTPPPSEEIQSMVDEVRIPGGKTILGEH